MSQGVVVKDRTKALLLLAGSRYDVYAPGPKGDNVWGNGKAAATVKEVCLLCDGERVTKDKFGREQTCESCKGRGYHMIDPMLNKEYEREKGAWQEQSRTSAGTRRALCDRCGGSGVWKQERCEMCSGAGKVSVPITRAILSESDREVDVALNEWERMIELRERSGSYAQYDAAISELARRSPHLHKAFHRVHVLKNASPGLLHPTEALSVERAIAKLLGWMPREILVPREIVAMERRGKQDAPKGRHSKPEDRAIRDAEIVARFDRGKGESAKELASTYGLSVPRVNEIVYAEREVA